MPLISRSLCSTPIVSLILLAGLALVSGCATMSQTDCVSAEWDSIGYKDAASGRASEFLNLHDRACTKHGIEPDSKLYAEGFRRGLYDYCVPAKGYQLGIRAEKYHFSCPSDVGREFLVAYIQGLEEHWHLLDSRYQQLDFRLWAHRPHRHEHSGGGNHGHGHGGHHHHRYHRWASYRDDLKYERYRVEGLIRHSRSHLADYKEAG